MKKFIFGTFLMVVMLLLIAPSAFAATDGTAVDYDDLVAELAVAGSSVTVSTEITIPVGGNVTIQDGVTLNVNAGGTLNVVSGGTLNVNTGGRLNVNTGGTLRLSGMLKTDTENTLEVAQGGTMIVESSGSLSNAISVRADGSVYWLPATAPPNSLTLDTGILYSTIDIKNNFYSTSNIKVVLSAGDGVFSHGTKFAYPSITAEKKLSQIPAPTREAMGFTGFFDSGNVQLTADITFTDGSVTTYTSQWTDLFWVEVAQRATPNVDYTLTAGDNLTIHTAAGMAYFAASVNGELKNADSTAIAANDYSGKTVTLSADIDLTTAGVSNYTAATVTADSSWTAIGYFLSVDDQSLFNGTFDGANYTVSAVYINNTDNFQGLFGFVGSDAVIKSVGVLNSSINGNNRVGGVVGFNYGTVVSCYNTGSVSGADDVGGVVGYSTGEVVNCYNTGNVSGNTAVGGVVGYVFSGNLLNSYNYSGAITNVSGNTGAVGEVVGINNANVDFCYYPERDPATEGIGTSSIDAKDTSKAFAVEDMTAAAFANTLNNWVSAQRSASSSVSYAMSLKYWAMVANSSPIFGDFLWTDVANTAIPDIDYTLTADDNLTIHTAAGLAYLAASVNGELKNADGTAIAAKDYNRKTVTLSADIDLTTAGVRGYTAATVTEQNSWIPIGNASNHFFGNFDGRGHTISGVYINKPNIAAQGLFGSVGGGTIQNLGVIDSDIVGFTAVGGIVAIGSPNVKNCYYTGKVSGNANVGGIIGHQSNNDIYNCYFFGEVSGTTSVGGIVGRLIGGSGDSVVRNSYFREDGGLNGVGYAEDATAIVENVVSKTDAQMQEQAFTDRLNDWVGSNITENSSLRTWVTTPGGTPTFGSGVIVYIGGDFTLVSNEDFDSFASIAVNGKTLTATKKDNDTYTLFDGTQEVGRVYRGSIRVEFTEAYMKTLPAGINRVDITLTDGRTERFYINNQISAQTSAQTPDQIPNPMLSPLTGVYS